MAPKNLDKIREFLRSKMGLHYDKKHETALFAKLSKAATDFNFRDTNKFIDWLLQQEMNASQIKLLANSLTIGETYFFREENAIEYLRSQYLPELIEQNKNKKKKIRIWSAGCSSGEEPYTLAIILQQTLPNYKDWDITILASDINPGFLNKARKGIYSNWSFRKTPESFKSRYFKKIDENNYQIIDSVKEMVTFSHLNLASDEYPSTTNNTHNYDVIFCRNVLIYFSNEGIKTVTKKFHKALNLNGMLAVSPVETPHLLSSPFSRITLNGNTIFRKSPIAVDNINPKKAEFQLAKFSPNKITWPMVKNQTTPVINFSAPRKTSKIISNSTTYKTNAHKHAKEYFKPDILKEAKHQLKENKSGDKNNEKEKLLLQARTCADNSQLEKSEKYCRSVLNLDKINTEAHYLLATVYSEQGKYQETIQMLNNLLFLDPDYAVAHFLLGNTFFKMGNTKYGSKHLSNAQKCLSKLNDNEIINECDGLSASQLSALIDTLYPKTANAKVI